LSIGGIAISAILALKLAREGKSLSDIVSTVGSVASFFGLIIALLQIKSVKEITETTQRAIAETREQLIVNISISELAKAIKLIEQIQTYLRYNEFHLAHTRACY